MNQHTKAVLLLGAKSSFVARGGGAYTGSMRRGVAMRKAEYATRRAAAHVLNDATHQCVHCDVLRVTCDAPVGMIWPPPRCSGVGSIEASMRRNFTLRMGSSHRGPSLQPHWKPCTTVQGSGARAWGMGFGVWGLGFGVWGLGLDACDT